MVEASSGVRFDICSVSESMARFLSVSVGILHWAEIPSHPQFPAVNGASQSARRPRGVMVFSMSFISVHVYMGCAPPIMICVDVDFLLEA